jgi:hypothetical protein
VFKILPGSHLRHNSIRTLREIAYALPSRANVYPGLPASSDHVYVTRIHAHCVFLRKPGCPQQLCYIIQYSNTLMNDNLSVKVYIRIIIFGILGVGCYVSILSLFNYSVGLVNGTGGTVTKFVYGASQESDDYLTAVIFLQLVSDLSTKIAIQ